MTQLLEESPAVSLRLRRIPRTAIAIIPVYALAAFASSALLFLIEPMFAKMVLPMLGGTPSVWNTCLVCFQALLLAGYAYGHYSIRWLGVRRQARMHLLLLLLPLIALPIVIPHGWSPPASANPIGWLALLLLRVVGLPFLAVSTTAPIIQRWFSTSNHKSAADPYFLYTASNIGSIAALIGYPLLVEPHIHLASQGTLWAVGYGALAVLTFGCWFFVGAAESPAAVRESAPVIALPRRLRWIVLSLVPSSLLLGVTTFITTDIAAVPLFWIVPLTLYLLSFALVFSPRRLIPQRAMVRALPIVMLGLVLFMVAHAAQPVAFILLFHLAALFVTAMVCHGELADDRPSVAGLTDFYLTISLGGVLGGLFNGLLAPLIFRSAAEYPIALVAACALCPTLIQSARGRRISPSPSQGEGGVRVEPSREGRNPSTAPPNPRASSPATRGTANIIGAAWPLAVGIAAFFAVRYTATLTPQQHSLKMLLLGIPVVLAVPTIRRRWRFAATMGLLFFFATSVSQSHDVLVTRRSFFGIHRIIRNSAGPFNDLYHGTTVHGRQIIDAKSLAPIDAQTALTYYDRTGPIGQILSDPAFMRSHRSMAVIGLGVGSLAAYADSGTRLTYFEIDPVVRWAAEDSGYFTFLGDARKRGASIDIVLGDARLTLRNAPPHGYDLLVLDAFSGDAIPVHLLTRQAMALYQDKLADGGLLAIHISNMYLDLLPVAAALAGDAKRVGLYQNDLDLTPAQAAEGKSASQWLVIARTPTALGKLAHDPRWKPLPPENPSALWTDDFSNVLTVFRWH